MQISRMCHLCQYQSLSQRPSVQRKGFERAEKTAGNPSINGVSCTKNHSTLWTKQEVRGISGMIYATTWSMMHLWRSIFHHFPHRKLAFVASHTTPDCHDHRDIFPQPAWLFCRLSKIGHGQGEKNYQPDILPHKTTMFRMIPFPFSNQTIHNGEFPDSPMFLFQPEASIYFPATIIWRCPKLCGYPQSLY